MNPTVKTTPARSSRPRSRFGYDRRFWGPRAKRDPATTLSYWTCTRRPLPCLVFVLPILIAYELGVDWMGGASAEALRTGADAWARQAFSRFHLTDRWFPPLVLVVAMLAWQALGSSRWPFRPVYLLGMAFESLLLAAALIGMGRLVELGFDRLEGGSLLDASSARRSAEMAAILGYLGAGVYEEALFRLALIPLIYRAAKAVQSPELAAGTLAVTTSALFFSLAHHAGAPGEPFTLFAFVFRWLAGIYFAWVFLQRGFGIAVGTHALYDILVGWAGFHF